MIDQIPGVTESKAATIHRHYPEWKDLYRAYMNGQTMGFGSRESELQLKELGLDDGYGRHIGSAISKRLFHSLFNNDPEYTPQFQ